VNAADFQLIVAAKEQLAGSIAAGIADVSHPSAPAVRLQAAADMLQQNLLDELAPGYAVSTLVQYPLNVTSSPYNDPATAPRLAGSATYTTFTTAPSGTPEDLHTVATSCNVSAPYVAQTLANAVGVLEVGQQVVYAANPTPYTIGPGDSLATIAAQFGVQPADLAKGLSVKDPTKGLFAASTALNVSPLTHLVGATDTLSALAGLFGRSIENLGLANEDVPGLVPPGTYTINRRQVSVQRGERLAAIAAAAATTSQQAALDLAAVPLSAGVSAYGLQFGKSFSLSTAKVDVAKAASPPLLTFLLDVKSPATTKSLTLNLGFVVNQLECPLGPPNPTTGYQGSDWLSFVLPFSGEGATASTAIGQVEIPVPLRAYPALPTLLSQSGGFASPPASVADLRLWVYQLEFRHDRAAQDTDYFTVAFNQQPKDTLGNGGYDLAQALARFASVYPQVQQDLTLLPTLAPGATSTIASLAIAALCELVVDVATGWSTWWPQLSEDNDAASDVPGPPTAGDTGAPTTTRFRVDVAPDSNGNLSEVTLTAAAQTPPHADVLWPNLDVRVGDTWQPLTAQSRPAGARQQVFTYRGPSVQASSVSTWRARFTLDLVQQQNAWASVTATRNQDLLPGTSTPTNPAFVYQTPEIGFPDQLVPLLEWSRPLLFGTQGQLQQSLLALATELLGEDGGNGTPPVSVACTLGVPVGVGLATSFLPIALGPRDPTAPLSPTDLAAQLTQAITWWSNWAYGMPTPPVRGGTYCFALSVFSRIDPRRTQPLLRAQRLTYKLT
jgi:hypothetical protein